MFISSCKCLSEDCIPDSIASINASWYVRYFSRNPVARSSKFQSSQFLLALVGRETKRTNLKGSSSTALHIKRKKILWILLTGSANYSKVRNMIVNGEHHPFPAGIENKQGYESTTQISIINVLRSCEKEKRYLCCHHDIMMIQLIV